MSSNNFDNTMQSNLLSDSEYAMQIAREESGSSSDVEVLNSQFNQLNNINNARDENRAREYELLKKESDLIKKENEESKKKYEDIKKVNETVRYDQMKRDYESIKREKDLLSNNLYRDRYDIDKERRLLNLGLNMIPYTSINRNNLEDKIAQVVKQEMNKSVDTQKNEDELLLLIKTLIKKSEPSRKPVRRIKRKSAKKSKKKSAKKSKKKSAKKPAKKSKKKSTK